MFFVWCSLLDPLAFPWDFPKNGETDMVKKHKKCVILLGFTRKSVANFRLLLLWSLTMLSFNYQGLCLDAYQFEQFESTIEHVFPPNDHDLFALLSKPENAGKVGKLFVGIVNAQNPMISEASLLKLAEAKQNSISNFRCRYTVFEEDFGSGSNSGVTKKTVYEFAVSENKLYFAYEYLDDRKDGSESAAKKSYDGERIISLLIYRDGHLHAGIQKPEPDVLMGFFRGSMPLSLARLFDPRLCGLSEGGWLESNLMLFLQSGHLYGIFEKKEMIDGHECIIVADLMSRFYLDPKRDFSVVQSEGYRLDVSDAGHVVGRRLASRTRLFDLQDHGNGIWIPYRAVIESFDSSGDLTDRSSIEVSLVEINKGLDDDFFTNFIPDDTLVADVVTGLVYEYGDRPSINALLKNTVKSKRVWFFQIISMTVGILMILTWAILKFLGYRRNKIAT